MQPLGAGAPAGAAARFPGCDPVGAVFVRGDRVLRGIAAEHVPLVREMLRRCERSGLFAAGIVPTRECDPGAIPDATFPLVLEHERIPCISYPHEWPASALKEAAVFILRLARDLGAAGIALKDWHPYNVLYKGTEPVFVDFASLLPAEALRSEAYLKPPQTPLFGRLFWDEDAVWLNEVYRRTFVPFCLRPLKIMAARRHAEARRRLWETALNTAAETITEQEVTAGRPLAALRSRVAEGRRRVALAERGPRKRRFVARLEAEIAALRVAPAASPYGAYYEEKGEDLPFEPSPAWPEKPRIVHGVLKRLRPASVLDLGCNTGWYSILAARLGAAVTALDVDEHCVDALWTAARNARLALQPLVLDVDDLARERFPLEGEDPHGAVARSLGPLLLRPSDRLGAELVLALAIAHHLALGRGWARGRIAETLAGLTRRVLIVEFVAASDPLVAADPGFFPAWAADPGLAADWSLEGFVAELRRHFASVDVHPAPPGCRTVLVCTR